MNREIEFKTKRKDNKEWYFGSLLILENVLDSAKHDYYIEDEFGDRFEVIEETISQYTNFKDKNDNKIYEHDKVLFDGRPGVVIWKDFAWNIQYKKHESDTVYSYKCLEMFMKDYVERIGNIYDEEDEEV